MIIKMMRNVEEVSDLSLGNYPWTVLCARRSNAHKNCRRRRWTDPAPPSWQCLRIGMNAMEPDSQFLTLAPIELEGRLRQGWRAGRQNRSSIRLSWRMLGATDVFPIPLGVNLNWVTGGLLPDERSIFVDQLVAPKRDPRW